MSVGTLTREARDPAFLSKARTFSLDRDVLILGILIVLAGALRFALIGHQGFWFDEGNTSQEVHNSPGAMLTLLKHYESTPPFYYCVAWVWARIFGFGETGLRSLSAVCGVLVVPVAFGLGDKLISRRAGLTVAALAAFNPLLIWYSQEARAYEMVVLLTGVSILAFAYAHVRPGRWALAAWAIACALAVATEYYSVLVIAPEALWLLYVHRRERPVQVAIAAVAVWSLPLLWFAISQNATGHASWIAPLPLSQRAAQIVPQFLVGFGTPEQQLLTRIAEVAALAGLVALAVRVHDRNAPERGGALLTAGTLLTGVLISVLLVATGIDNLITRNLIPLWLPAAVLVAAGLAGRPRARRPLAFQSRSPARRALGLRPRSNARRLSHPARRRAGHPAGLAGLAIAAVLCGIGAAAAIGVDLNRNLQRPDWRDVAHVLGVRPQPGLGERAILIQLYRTVLPLSLYMPGLRSWQHHGTDKYSVYTGTNSVSEFDVVAISAPRVNLCWWGSACNLAPSELQGSYQLPRFHVRWIRHSHQFTILRMVAAHPVPLTPQLVRRALTNTNLLYDDLLIQR